MTLNSWQNPSTYPLAMITLVDEKNNPHLLDMKELDVPHNALHVYTCVFLIHEDKTKISQAGDVKFCIFIFSIHSLLIGDYLKHLFLLCI